MRLSVLLALLGLALGSSFADAQVSNGTIAGTVKDTSGAVLPRGDGGGQ